jgi:ribonuclease III
MNILEANLGHRFADPALLGLALTHASADAGGGTYERLEFLGDRVLGLIVAEWLYEAFPDEPEGALAVRLAALVSGPHLAEVAGRLGLGAYMRFSGAEAAAGGAGNAHLLADGFEAVLGALYLDGGLAPARAFVRRAFGDAIWAAREPPRHPKTALQEWAQGRGLPLPVYEVVARQGPDHAPAFTVEARVEGHEAMGLGTGPSRAAAERVAAMALLEVLG